METISAEGLPKTAICEPAGITVEPGKVYSWCSCGLSAKEPFCDSAHKAVEGMPFRSVKVIFDKAEEIVERKGDKGGDTKVCSDKMVVA